MTFQVPAVLLVISNVHVISVEDEKEEELVEILVCPDLARTIVAPETKPVPANAVILTELVLSPFAGVMLEMVGADATAVRVAERGVV